jgi:hypothetical protein
MKNLVLLSCLVLATLLVALPLRADDLKWDMDSLCQVVHPMQHSMAGRPPLLCWVLPLPLDDQLVKMRADGSLRRDIDRLAARGIVPTVDMVWNWTPAGAIAMAQTLQEAGRPVYVLVGGDFMDGDQGLYRNSPKIMGPSPFDKDGNLTWHGEQEWPILPLYDTSQAAAYYAGWMKKYQAAGVKVDGLWLDYEGLPNQWNFVYEAQKKPEAAKYYPAGALDSFASFAEYVGKLRTKVLEEAYVNPVRSVFPHALVGSYGDCSSSRAYPVVGVLGETWPPRSIGGLSATMPSVYADTVFLPRYYNLDWPVTQDDVDQVYFSSILRAASTALANKEPNRLGIPFISRYCPENPDPRYAFPMSQGPYREFLRHTFLRGADDVYIFNAGPNFGTLASDPASYKLYLESIEDARSVLDEMLGYREFVEHGKPMNFDLPAMRTTGIVWSGLALPDEVLVRTFTFGPEEKTLDLIPFPGVAVKLAVTNRGETYEISRQGFIRRVSSGLM